jgi:BASS family bile acid:Na+ symporter
MPLTTAKLTEICVRILKNSAFVFLLAILLGFVMPSSSRFTEPFITPALMLMMAFSLTEVDLRARGALRSSLIGFLLNYGLLSGLIISLAYTLENESLRSGLIVMAAVPPAVAVLPMTRLLSGDVLLSLYAETVSYLASPILMPVMIFAFTSRTEVRLGYLVETALLLILVPALASRYIRRLPLDPVLPINAGFFLVTYTVIGLNIGAPWELIGPVGPIALARTFGIGIAVYIAAALAGSMEGRRISYTLLGSFKNLGLAAAVALILFGPEAAIPAAVCILAETAFYIVLYLVKSRKASFR